MPAPIRTRSIQPGTTGHSFADRFWALALLLIVLVVVGLRPLIQETHDSARGPLSIALSDVPEIGPLTTLCLGTTNIAVFGLTLWLVLRGVLSAPRCRLLVLGYVILTIAAVASCIASSNHRLAINATVDWLSLLLLAWSLCCLIRQQWHVYLALILIVAAGVASAANCFDQILVTFPDTIDMYEQDKAAFWQQNHISEDSYHVALLEKRIYGNAASGFFALSNIAGNFLILSLFSALALAAHVRQHPGRLIAALILAAVIAIGMWYTRSRGALVATLFGLVAVVVIVAGQRLIMARKNLVFVLCWCAVAAVFAASIGYGLVNHRLPGNSLTYRWWYLEATANMVVEHPLVGVGTEQYGRFYTRYKDIRSPEEISNPHNLFAQVAAEWGLLGTAGWLLMLIAGSRLAAGLDENARRPRTNNATLSATRLVSALALVTVVVWMLRVLLTGYDDESYILASNAYPLIGWTIACLLLCFALNVGSESTAAATRANGWTATIAALGLFAFLIHNLITFGLFVPGSATVFFALLAIVVADRRLRCQPLKTVRRPRSKLAAIVLVATPAAVALMYGLCVKPARGCWSYLQQARAAQERQPQVATDLFISAHLLDPLDPTPLRERLQLYVAMRGRGILLSPHTVQQHLHDLQRLDPENVNVYRLAASVLFIEGDYAAAARHYEQVLKRYPSNPDDHLRMAEILHTLANAENDPDALKGAIRELELALRLDAARPGADEVRRFASQKREALIELLSRWTGQAEAGS